MEGKIIGIAGPVVKAKVPGVRNNEIVYIGGDQIIGEVIALEGKKAIIQAYEDTTGLKPGEKITKTGKMLSVELGPGLLKTIFDGIQRPLTKLRDLEGPFISRGVKLNSLDRKKKWHFKPQIKKGQKVKQGEILGLVKETKLIDNLVLVPPEINGKVEYIAKTGDYTVDETIAKVGGRKINMIQEWPVRIPRPFLEKLQPNELLVTGQRVFDVLFPLAKGGTATIPGGFGSGKTILGHILAQYAHADVVIYCGCGERGNEMVEILEKLPNLKTEEGVSLVERSILIANTSNMPLAAREASVFTGVTLAEYYRDQGYDVFLMADSTSRWAEAMREISGRLEEIPSEEGYPPYLASRINNFYERAGKVVTLGERRGSVSIIGAVSPPGGDLYEPVTQSTLRVIKVLWALDTNLAYRRHYPAINWFESYSLYIENLKNWMLENFGLEALNIRNEVMKILQEESRLQDIVRLVGRAALSYEQKLVLDTAKLVRTGFLQQNAYSEHDSFCKPEKSFRILKLILDYHNTVLNEIKKGGFEKMVDSPIRKELTRMKELEYIRFLKKSEEIGYSLKKMVKNA